MREDKERTGMKLRHIVCLCVCMAPAQLVLAAAPMSAPALATLQGTIDFCARTYPDTATSLEEFAKLLVQGFAEDELDKVRKSDDFKATYAQVSEDLHKTHPNAAKEACNGFLAQRP